MSDVIADLVVRINGDTTGLRGDLNQSESTAKKMAKGIASIAGPLAVGAAVKGILTLGNAYQGSLNTFRAVSGANAAQMAQVSARAKQLGNDLTIPGASAKDAAEAMVELAKGGLSVNDAMKAAQGTLRLAAAAQVDGATAATIQANALSQFRLGGEQAAHVADLLANAANAATGEVTDIANALSYVGPVANSMGVSVDSAATSIGLLAKNGILSDKAGTSLRGMLVSLVGPSKDAAGGLQTLGIQAFDQQGRFKGLEYVTGQLAKAKGNLSDQEFQAASAAAFGREPLAAINALAAEGTAGFDKMATAVGKNGGATELAAAKMEGLGGAVQGLRSQLEGYAINIYEKVAPLAETAVRAVSDKLPELVSVAGEAAGKVGTAISTGLSKIPTEPVEKALDGAAGLLGSEFVQNLGDAVKEGNIAGIGLVIAKGLSSTSTGQALIDGITTAVKTGNFQPLGTAIGEAASSALGAASSAVKGLSDALGNLLGQVKWVDIGLELGKQAPAMLFGLALGLLNFDIMPIISGIGDHWLEVIIAILTLAFLPAKVVGKIAEVLAKVPLVGPLLRWIFEAGVGVSKRIVNFALDYIVLPFARGFASVFGYSRGVIGAWINNLVGAIAINVNFLFKAVADFIGAIPRGIASVSERIGRAAGNVVLDLLRPFGNLAAGLFRIGREAIVALARAIVGATPEPIRIVAGLPLRFLAAIGDLIGLLRTQGVRLISGIVRGILDKWGEVVSFARSIGGRARDAVGDLGRILWNAGVQLIRGFIGGIGSMFGAVKGKLGDLTGKLTSWKGPESLDKVILYDSGRMVIDGFINGLQSRYGAVQASLRGLTTSLVPSLADIKAAQARALATPVETTALAQLNAQADYDAKRRAATSLTGIASTASNRAGSAENATTAAKRRLDQLAASTEANVLAARREAQALRASADAAGQRAAAMPSATKAQQAAKDAAQDHARALAYQAREAARAATATNQTGDAAVRAARARYDALKKVSDAASAAAKTASTASTDAIRTATEAARTLADAHTSYLDAVYSATVDIAKQQAADAASSMDALVAKADSMRSAFSGGLLQGTGLTELFGEKGTENSVLSVLDALEARVRSGKAFAADLGTLTAAGLSDGVISQLAAAGPDVGQAMATALLQAGPDALARLNSASADLAALAQTGMDPIVQGFYGSGISAGQQFIAGLASQFSTELASEVDAATAKALSVRGTTVGPGIVPGSQPLAPVVVNLQPADVILDGKVVGQVIFPSIQEEQRAYARSNSGQLV